MAKLQSGSGDENPEYLRLQREYRELEENYRKLERLYFVLETVLENSTDAIQISDHNLVTIRVNKAYEVLTGIKREELVGMPVRDLVGTMISESCGAIVQQTKKPHTILQAFYRTNRTAHVSCNPVFGSDGEIIFYICNDRDLDEIRRLQTELYETKKLNERYLSEIEAMKSQLPVRTSLIAEDKKCCLC